MLYIVYIYYNIIGTVNLGSGRIWPLVKNKYLARTIINKERQKKDHLEKSR